jgi:hypothetical protein
MSGINPYAVHAQGIGYLQASMGTACPVIAWQGNNYQILPGSARLKEDLAVGGFSMDSDFLFTILVATFGANTQAENIRGQLLNTRIDYLNHAYKIHTVSVMAGGLQLHIEADDLQQKA